MFDTAILVLLYNKEIEKSNTINSLVTSNCLFENSKILIWNNGPNSIKEDGVIPLLDLGYEVEIKETLNNESLSVIYNEFIDSIKSDKYIILDDDSALSSDFITAAAKSDVDIVSFPFITSQEVIVYPKVDNLAINKKTKLNDESNLKTIGSGIVLGNQICQKLKEYYGSIFDERFYFYGVDSTLCLRLKELQLISKIKLIDGFEHSMSRFEKESEEVSHFRKVERSYDFGLTLKYYYPKKKAFFEILMYMIMTFKRKLLKQPTEFSFFLIVKSFLTGKHYRNVSHGKKT
ncbi:MAG: hypothetical protein HRU18_17635 [Pseudoalteromonas sp.]|uniref:hypothetical protein n=1 Tax=Pseudoalteromonas sp. TaxID=53249 RepID=UPI001D840BB6|nr:hypothetical protein [Pseudoalteromonas sp.]NRA80026.1 hypothetical protein [Pseudoalteromonas sp.]